MGSSVSPEHIWLAPETFACLESLGVANNEDLPYEMFGLNATENGFDRVSAMMILTKSFSIIYIYCFNSIPPATL